MERADGILKMCSPNTCRHGFGRWVNPNGDCYEGTFVYDARHGSGTYTWKNGNVYRGDFFEDKRQGKVRE
jgi:hypothetical protein